MVWHVDKYKITFKLVISPGLMKWAFRHIHEYYSPQNISTIKYLFMRNV